MENEVKEAEKEFHVNKYFGLVVPFIIFLGMVRLIIYYNEFGVSIVSYLEITEVIASFFDILVIIISFFVATSFQRFITADKKREKKISDHRNKILNEDDDWKIVKLYFSYLKIPLLICFGISLVALLGFFIFNWLTIWEIVFIPSIFIVMFIYVMIDLEIERKHLQFKSTPGRRRYVGMIFYSMIFLIMVILYSKYQVRQVRVNHSTEGTSILLNNGELVVSDQQNYFIGKTNNYVFFFHIKSKTTDVYPMNQIKQITVKDNRKNKKYYF